jgi:hypothetical protein
MTAICGHYDIATGDIRFHFVEIEKLNGEDAILVDDEELQTIREINGDEWNDEVVRGETRADIWTRREIENILKKRFSFLK